MRNLPAIAFAVSVPGCVWRVETGFAFIPDSTAADVARYEQRRLGRSLEIPPAFWFDLESCPAWALLWAAFSREDALRRAHPEDVAELCLDIPAYVIATDNQGGFLLFFPDAIKQPTGGDTMANRFENDPAADVREEIKAETYTEAGLSPPAPTAISNAADPVQQATMIQAPPVNDLEDEEAKRRAGHGGGDSGNPAHANLGANIRPDVVSAPGGLETITTAKSADHDAHPDQQNASDYIRGLLARAEESANAPEQPEPERAASDESTKRQEAERAARAGETVPGDVSLPARDYIADLLNRADEVTRAEEGPEVVTHDQSESRSPGDSGGRGMS